MDTPRLAVVTDHPNIETKCEDLSKAIIALQFLIENGQLKSPAEIC